MQRFNETYEEWLQSNIAEEKNKRRRELLEKGLGHGTVEFLRRIWFPLFGNFNNVYPEWEIRDFNNNYRYLDLAYRHGNSKGCIEIQGYGPHARDLDVRRFKDLCWRHSLLSLEGWTILPIAYLSIRDEPKQVQQLVLALIGKFTSTDTPTELNHSESEIVRYARRIPRPITPQEIALHLKISDRHARGLLHQLVSKQILTVASGNKRARSFKLQDH